MSSLPPPFVSGFKIVNEKAVKDVLGEAFNYDSAFIISSAFCKKALIWAAKEFSTENLLFVLICSKYSQSPSRDKFNQIYTEFVVPKKAPRETNLTSAQIQELKAVFEAIPTDPPTIPPMTIFNAAVKNIRAVASGDTLFRLKQSPLSKAFTLTPAQKTVFDDAVSCLRSYDIVLM